MKKVIFKLLVLLVALLLLHSLSFGQIKNEDLLDQKVDLNYTNTTLVYVLSKIVQIYKVPVGLEKSSSDEDKENLNISVKNISLKEALNLIVEQNPAYKWEFDDGVVNFIPIKDRYDFTEKFLSTRINDFSPQRGISTSEVRNTIIKLPEVNNLLFLNKVKLIIFDSPGLKFYKDETDLSISNTDVKGILNNIIKKGEYKMWTVDMFGEDKERLIISF